jgi:type II restriction enzyme
MNLSMTGSLADRFKSGSQKAGNVTEAWGAENFYCPNCSSPKLDWLKPGTKASDYKCPACGFWYQLKSKKSRIGKSVRDGAYGAMMEAIKEDRAPSYFFLHYEITPPPPQRGGEGRGEVAQLNSPHPASGHLLPVERGEGMLWSVRNLLLVPSFAFPPSAIIKCPPLSPTARRAGWVGCNFDLNRIPGDARIAIVMEKQIVPEKEVREKFKKVKPLKELSVKERGWTLDVLNIVRRVVESRRRGDESLSKKSNQRLLTSSPTNEFTNEDVYAFADELEQLHPDNRHVRDKIRQQLQVLRDAKLLIHVGSGLWRLP